MKQYRVRYLDEAIGALRKAAEFIETQSGQERARGWLRRMLESVTTLETFPGAQPQVTVLDGRVVRSMLANPLRVYYVIEEISATVYVIDIVHSARETQLQRVSLRRALSGGAHASPPSTDSQCSAWHYFGVRYRAVSMSSRDIPVCNAPRM